MDFNKAVKKSKLETTLLNMSISDIKDDDVKDDVKKSKLSEQLALTSKRLGEISAQLKK